MCSAMSGCYCSLLFIFTLSDPDLDIANTCGHIVVSSQWLNAFKSNQNIPQIYNYQIQLTQAYLFMCYLLMNIVLIFKKISCKYHPIIVQGKLSDDRNKIILS